MLEWTVEDDTARIRLNHPPANVIDRALMTRLQEVIRQLHAAQDRIGFAVLESALPGKFSAGVSVPEHAPDRAPEMIRTFHETLWQWAHVPQVTVAVVDGYALGGAAEVLLLTDFIIASDRSQFGFPEIRLAFFPPVALAFLPDWVGYHRAASMILRGESVPAAAWAQWGLVERVVPAEGLTRAVADFLGELRRHSRAALRLTRRWLKRRSVEAGWTYLRAVEQAFIEDLLRLADAAEGVRAFQEKRPPQWTHR